MSRVRRAALAVADIAGRTVARVPGLAGAACCVVAAEQAAGTAAAWGTAGVALLLIEWNRR